MALLNGIFHMHGTGKSAITRHYRNGSELAPIAQLREFDYEFQGATGIGAQSRTLLPGDALTLQVCVRTACCNVDMHPNQVLLFGRLLQEYIQCTVHCMFGCCVKGTFTARCGKGLDATARDHDMHGCSCAVTCTPMHRTPGAHVLQVIYAAGGSCLCKAPCTSC